jgi:cytochrome c biogenesis protein CcmG, thiol:disulfide interchange protein DsbE
MRRRVLVAGTVLSAVLTGCTSESSSEPPVAAPPTESVLQSCPEQADQPAPAGAGLPALSFDCPGGGRIDLARAPGVPTVVNLWGSWCTPCREELPLFQELADGAGEQVRVLGLISKDGVPQAESFATDAGVSFPSAFDAMGQLMAELGLNALPYTAFLDADGRLVHSEIGPVESVDELRGLVAEHLGVQL